MLQTASPQIPSNAESHNVTYIRCPTLLRTGSDAKFRARKLISFESKLLIIINDNFSLKRLNQFQMNPYGHYRIFLTGIFKFWISNLKTIFILLGWINQEQLWHSLKSFYHLISGSKGILFTLFKLANFLGQNSRSRWSSVSEKFSEASVQSLKFAKSWKPAAR